MDDFDLFYKHRAISNFIIKTLAKNFVFIKMKLNARAQTALYLILYREQVDFPFASQHIIYSIVV